MAARVDASQFSATLFTLQFPLLILHVLLEDPPSASPPFGAPEALGSSAAVM